VRGVAWLLGLAALAFFWHRLGWQTIWGTVATVGPRLLWLVGVYTAGIAVMSLPWHVLLPAEARPSVLATAASRFAASGLNSLGPLLAVGELTRLLWIKRAHWPEGLAAIAVDRLIFLAASSLSLGAGAVAALLVADVPRALAIAAAAVAVAIVALAITLAVLARRFSPATAVGRLVAAVGALIRRMRGLAEAPDLAGAERTDAALHALLTGPRRPLLVAFALHAVGRVFVTAEFYAACRVLGIDASLGDVLVLAAVPLALSLVAGVVPSQVGIQEGAQGAVGAALGLGPDAGMLVVLLQRARQLVCLPIAALLLAVRPRADSSHATPTTESKPGPADRSPGSAGGVTAGGGPYGDLGSGRAAPSGGSGGGSRGRA
jgi:hypothetical protein